MDRRSRHSDHALTSLRPRPVTATVTKPSWMRPEAIVGPRSRSVESRGSTASLTSVLEHESCESLSDDGFRDNDYGPCEEDYRPLPTPTSHRHEEDKENMGGGEVLRMYREIHNNTDNRKEKKVLKKKIIRKFVESSQTDETETESEPPMSPWEQWLIQKVKDDRQKRRDERQKKRDEKAKKTQEEQDKQRKLQRAEDNRHQWVERKNFEEKLKKKLDKQREKTEVMIKEEQKKMTEVKADRKFKEWLETKKQEELKKKREEKQKEEEEQMLQKEQKVKAQRKFEEWCRKAEQKPRPLPNSFGYTSGKLTGYHDTSAYPVPTFYNPMPWQPIHIPRPASEKKQKRKSKPKPKYVWNPEKYR